MRANLSVPREDLQPVILGSVRTILQRLPPSAETRVSTGLDACPGCFSCAGSAPLCSSRFQPAESESLDGLFGLFALSPVRCVNCWRRYYWFAKRRKLRAISTFNARSLIDRWRRHSPSDFRYNMQAEGCILRLDDRIADQSRAIGASCFLYYRNSCTRRLRNVLRHSGQVIVKYRLPNGPWPFSAIQIGVGVPG